ncbi:MAG TPA: hypothetical protein VNE58_09530 [Casimicrobiaceae bacterium]|nr:hypothetical protein [Casimicrobiaceae bacterium]
MSESATTGSVSASLDAYLRAQLPAFDGSIAIEPIAGGQSNPTFRVRCGADGYVLRKQPEGELLPSAHAAWAQVQRIAR